MSILSIPPQALSALEHTVTSNRFQVASAGLLIYDIIITFPQEISLVWARQWSLVSLVYVAARYLPLVDAVFLLFIESFATDISPQACKKLHIVVSIIQLVSFPIDLCILILRTHAIWNRRIITYFLALFLLLDIAGSAYIVTDSFKSVMYIPNPFSTAIPGCLLGQENRKTWFSVLILLVFETGVLLLTAFKIFAGKDDPGTPAGSALFRTIYRDGAIFFFYVFMLTTFFIVVLNVAPDALAPFPAGFHRVLHSIWTTRIVLHIRSQLSDSGGFTMVNTSELSRHRRLSQMERSIEMSSLNRRSRSQNTSSFYSSPSFYSQ